MKIEKLAFTIAAVALLSGCSTIKSRLLGHNTITTTASTEPLEYNFIAPRRSNLSQSTGYQLTNPSSADSGYYYSANGHTCKTLTSDYSKSACQINGNWMESANILITNLP